MSWTVKILQTATYVWLDQYEGSSLWQGPREESQSKKEQKERGNWYFGKMTSVYYLTIDMLEINKVHCWDCLELMKQIPDKSVDLVITDPPYEFISKNPQGWGFMKKENKKHLDELNESFGMSFKPEKFLTLIKQKLKVFNAYIFTNKSLLLEYIQFAEKNKYKREN